MTRNNGYAGCIIYVRISAADVRRARAQAHGDREKLAALIAEKITSHVSECRRYAEAEGWPVLAVRTDNMVSGNSRHRSKNQTLPGREATLADLRERKGQRIVLLSTEVERLYRDTDESRELVALAQYTPITVVSTDGEEYDLSGANGEDRFNGAVSKAQRESDKVSERRRRKERKRAEEGGYWGSEPFGYHKIYDVSPETGQRYYTGRLELCTGSCCELAGRDGCTHHGNGCWLTPGRPLRLKPGFWQHAGPEDYDASDDDDSDGSGPLGEAEWITLTAWALVRGASLGSLMRQWDNIGLTTRNGERWTQMMLRNLLLNKRLAGIRVHRPGDKWGRADRKGDGTETPGQWPAILGDELFAAVRGVLTDPERYKHVTPGPHRAVREHLLAGLAECGGIWGPEGGSREGKPCGTKMVGHRSPRRLSDGTMPRQYVCPKVHGGCGRTHRLTDPVDRYVIQHVLHWTAPGGPYEEFVARERALHDAGRAAVAAELAGIETEQAALSAQRATVDATRRAALRSGDLQPGTDMWEAFGGTFRDIDEQKAALGARAAKLLAAAPPATADDQRRDLALLTDPDVPVGIRADLVRRFVARVIIAPPGQGVRAFDPDTVEVIPGPWADGLDTASLAVPATAEPARAGRPRDAITAALAARPWSEPREIAEAIARSHSATCRVLAGMRERGEVIADRPGRGGAGGRPVRYAVAGTTAAPPPEPERKPGPKPGAKPRAGAARLAVREYLAAHPDATTAEIAAAIGRADNTASYVLTMMREAGEVTASRRPGGGGPPIRYRLAG